MRKIPPITLCKTTILILDKTRNEINRFYVTPLSSPLKKLLTNPPFTLKEKKYNLGKKKTYRKLGDTWNGELPKPKETTHFNTFQDALDKMKQFQNNLEYDLLFTVEEDKTFPFFGNGKTIERASALSLRPRAVRFYYIHK